MAFGAGVLIAALSFELVEEAYQKGGFTSTAVGFFIGGGLFTAANYLVERKGARHRKRSQKQQLSEIDRKGSGLALAIGALLDGIPEAIAIGVGLIDGGTVSVATVVAVFISNFPEALSSSSGMKKAGRPKVFILCTWIVISILSGLASIIGFAVFSTLSATAISVTLAIAAGAILCMLADTMIPEAFEHGHNWVGLATLAGFLSAFILTKLD